MQRQNWSLNWVVVKKRNEYFGGEARLVCEFLRRFKF